MRRRLIHTVLVLGCVAGPVWADGLAVDAEQLPWPKLQLRVGLAPAMPLSTDLAGGAVGLQGGRLLGDYYFSGSSPWGRHNSRLHGGFRATSGLMLSSRGASLAMPTVPHSGLSLSVSQQTLSPPAGGDFNADNGHAVPYLGVGYTGLSFKGGWGFTADVGLMALHPGSGLRLSGVAPGNQSLDDVLRDLRLTPVLQLGLSYLF